ncbi:MAG: Xaa-Pro peptidase family protein [Anaerolineales bacterium]|nr:Xaa-Pro peptidase family protein [Anaerolineales bacterium]
MKSDIDRLMRERNIDALLITGAAQHNPAMVYLTGIAKLTQADLIKKQGEAPVVFYNSMERDSAAATGLASKCLDDYHPQELLKQAGGDRIKARVLRYQRMLEEFGVTSGRVLVYGKVDAGLAYATLEGLGRALPDLTILGEAEDSLLMEAMMTKDADEAARMKRMGEITLQIVDKLVDWLTSQRARDGVLVKKDGTPCTIDEAKRLMDLWGAERGVEYPDETIFSLGRDAGVPHNPGNPEDALRLGETIILDIFPCERGGGYFYDFTRTWCLGYAPDQVQALYADVANAFNQVVGALKPDAEVAQYQKMVCEIFEAHGHPTVLSTPNTEVGYVHGLGHGVGLNIHERPFVSTNAPAGESLRPGSIFTVEPGLYYPDKGMGVRLEDTFWVQSDGRIAALVEYPKDLVLPVKSA